MKARTAATRLRSDRGDADPMLTISAMTITLLLATAILGSVVALLTIGSKYVADQVTTTSLLDARGAFAGDAQNASKVTAAGTNTVTFYEDASGSAVHSSRGVNTGCRVSQWKTTATAVTDKVWKIAGACPTAPPATGSTALFNITGFTSAPALTFKNTVGTQITFTPKGVASTPALPTKSYWTAAEFGSVIPKAITLSGTIALRGGGDRKSVLNGVTYLADDHDRMPSNVVERKPTVGKYDPTLAAVTVTRSSTVGAVYGGAKEGISIRWNASFCGPYIVRYDVTWKPTTPALPPQTYAVSGFLANYAKDFDNVPNGTIGTVSVKATCPTDVSTKPATTTKTYTQPVPAPTLTAKKSSALINVAAWTSPVSSLPTTFTPAASFNGGGWSNGPVTGSASWTHAESPGQQYTTVGYSVVAVAGGTPSLRSNTSVVTTVWPTVASPSVWSDAGGTSTPRNNRIIWSAVACPAGTSAEYQTQVNGGAWSGWSNTGTRNIAAAYSTRYTAAVRARCVTATSQSAAGAVGTTSWWTNAAPPVAPGQPGSVSSSYSRAAGGGGSVSISFSATARATSYEYGGSLTNAFGQATGYNSRTTSSAGSYVANTWCTTPYTIISAGVRVRAHGAGGWSGYTFASQTNPQGTMSCN